MSVRHVESHVPQNSRVTPATIAELLWSTASVLIWNSKSLTFFFSCFVFKSLSERIWVWSRAAGVTMTTQQKSKPDKDAWRPQVNTLPSTASHRPLSWHTERECSPTSDAILLFLEVGQSRQRFASWVFLFLVCLFVTPWPHKVTSPCDKPTSDQTNSEQTKHSWNKPQLLPAKIFFPSKPRNIFSLVQTSIRLYFKSTIYFLNTLQNFGSRSREYSVRDVQAEILGCAQKRLR